MSDLTVDGLVQKYEKEEEEEDDDDNDCIDSEACNVNANELRLAPLQD